MTDSRSELRFVSYEQAFDGNFEDMPRRVPDITKLRRVVGYEPRVQLNGIIDSVIQYWNAEQGVAQTPGPGRRHAWGLADSILARRSVAAVL